MKSVTLDDIGMRHAALCQVQSLSILPTTRKKATPEIGAYATMHARSITASDCTGSKSKTAAYRIRYANGSICMQRVSLRSIRINPLTALLGSRLSIGEGL